MMHNQHQYWQASNPLKERRLCGFSGRGAYESLRSSAEIQANENLNSARELYDNPSMRLDYADVFVESPLDRAIFLSLFLDGSLEQGDVPNYKEAEATNINAADIVGLLDIHDDKVLGQWVLDNMSLELRRKIDPGDDPGVLGNAFRQQIDRAKDAWDRMPKFKTIDEGKAERAAWVHSFQAEHDTVLKAPLERYQAIQAELKRMFTIHGVALPSNNLDSGDPNRLDRREYAALVTLIWKGRITLGDVNKKADEKGLEGVLEFLYKQDAIEEKLVDIFKKHAVSTPSSNNGPVQIGTNEYADLLVLLRFEQLTLRQIEEKLSTKGLNGVLELLEGKSNLASEVQKEVHRVNDILTDIASEELGPTEVLRGMNMPINTAVLKQYMEARRPTNGQKPIDSADTWLTDPLKAHMFLSSAGLPDEEGNREFLNALKYHFASEVDPSTQERYQIITQPDGRQVRTTIRQPKDPIAHSAKNVKAQLKSIVDKLRGYEDTKDKTSSQFAELRDSMNVGEKIEDTAKNYFEYIKEFREHPLGSALAATATFIVLRGVWQQVMRPKMRILNWAMYTGIVGSAVYLYQKEKHGESSLGNLLSKANVFKSKEKAKEPEEQTLPNYWMDQTGLEGANNQLALSVLQNEEIGTTLDWYRKMDLYVRNGKNRGDFPGVPFNIGGRVRSRFGDTSRYQIAEHFYESLHAFFEDRGKLARQETFDFQLPNGLTGDAGLGFAYINEEYVEQHYYEAIAAGAFGFDEIQLDATILRNWDPSSDPSTWPPQLQRIQQEKPAIFAKITRNVMQYQAQSRELKSSSWTMFDVFYAESNPEMLGRMNADAREAATALQKAKTAIVDAVDTVNPLKEAPEDDADIADPESILTSEENNLFIGDTAELRHTNFVRAEELKKQNALTALKVFDVADLILRVDLDDKASKKLAIYFGDFIQNELDKGTKFPELMNKLEYKKYQLLIAANKSDFNLSGEVQDTLDPANDATWDLVFDNVFDVVLPDDLYYPKVDKIGDIRSFFDSEARQRGGVEYWKVWARMFPTWKKSDFDILGKKLAIHEEAFRAMRANRPKALDDKGEPLRTLEEAEVDAIEKQLTLRYVNHLLYAQMVMHRKSGEHVFSDPTKKGVTKNEMTNLTKVYDELFEGIVGASAADVISNPKNAEPKLNKNIVQDLWDIPKDKIDAFWTKMQKLEGDYKFVGVGGLEKGKSIIIYLTEHEELHSMGVKIDDFIRLTPAELVDEWANFAVGEQMKDIFEKVPGMLDTFKDPKADVDVATELVTWGDHMRRDPATGELIALGKTSLREFLETPYSEIAQKYHKWWHDTPPPPRPENPLDVSL